MRCIALASILLLVVPAVHSQDVTLPPAALTGDSGLDAAIPTLADEVLAAYKENDRGKYLDTVFRLQLAGGHDAQAIRTLEQLQALERGANAPSPPERIVDRVYATARSYERSARLPFDAAYAKAFREIVGALDDITAARVARSIGSPGDPYGPRLDTMQARLTAALDRQKGKTTIALADALDLLRCYEDERSFAAYHLSTDALVAEDDRRRYRIDDNLLVRTPDGASLSTLLVRPLHARERLTTLLGFTIYANPVWSMQEARLTAAHGYAAVVSYTRGKGASPDDPVPLEHDGADADAVIEWIARQAWSDGRVGMYGGSYNGFTQWAAAKHLPRALKALMPSVTVAPGIDWPREGNIYMNFAYDWLPYTLTNKTLDQAHYDDKAHWDRLDKTLYTTGAAYRSLDRLDGAPKAVFQRWLDHPSYDAYWQAMIPYKKDFARIDIPVLTTTGYYDGGQIGALYYFSEHYKYNARAEHYLVIGPYNHIGAQRSAWNTLRGYEIDPVARIDIGTVLRYQWFDYVFRGGPKPALLKDKVNYEVMGANQWKHAPSLQAMSDGMLRFYLGATPVEGGYRLADRKPPGDAFVAQTVDFADRGDVDSSSGGQIVDTALDTRNATVFVSEPFPRPTEISGLFAGQLDLGINAKDVDLTIGLYERMADGRYFQLSWYMARASAIEDRGQRRLLTPGKRQRLAFTSGRTTSRRLEAGSRLVVVVSVNKQPGLQVDYGTGKDVSDETIADAKNPLQIQWFNDSYIDIPVPNPRSGTN